MYDSINISVMKLIPEDLRKEIEIRIEAVRRHMSKAGADALLVATNANIYYTTGRFFRGYVYIPLEGSPVWFVIKPDVYDREDDVAVIHKPEMIPGKLSEMGVPLPEAVGL